MITFVYGAPGSGKTHYIFEELKRNFENAYLIVPEQQTVTAERSALVKLPPSSALSFEVLNFTRLGNTVFRKYGGLSYHYITPAMKSLFMWRTLRELSPILKEYSAASKDMSLTEVMLRATDELKVAAVTPEMLDAAVSKLSDGSLKSKLQDISLISATYKNLVKESFDDKEDDLLKLCDILEKHKFFKGKRVFIDSFTSFTALEYRVIEYIFKQADEVTVTLGCESPSMPLVCSESICETARKLEELAKKLNAKTEKLFLRQNFRAKSEELSYIPADFWRSERKFKLSDKIPVESRGNIRLFKCLDPYNEADVVASLVRSEIKRGLRYKDIAIVARDASKYEGIIDAALESEGVPFYMSKSNDIVSSPAVAFILSALRIRLFGYRREDVLTHIKTGMCGIDMRSADMFENYIHTWNIAGARFEEDAWSMNPDGYTKDKSERGEAILSAANAVREKLIRELKGFFAELDAAENAKDMATALYRYVTSAGLDESLRRRAEEELERGNRRAASDTLAAWNVIMDVLDDIVTALGDERLTDEEFLRALQLSFKYSSVSSIPTGYDEVTIGSASLLRTDNVKCAILIGLNEGEFPASVNENGIFTDADRLALKNYDLELSSDSATRAAEELLFANRAMSIPSEKLYMLYSVSSSSGAALRPSMIVNRAMSFYDYLTPEYISVFDTVGSVSSALEKLPLLEGTIMGAAISDELDSMGISHEKMPISEPECTVSETDSVSLFGNRMALTQAKINKFVECPFGFYCDQVLELREEEKASVDSRISGTFIHSVLENFLRKAVTENGIEIEGIEASVDEIINGLIDSICVGEQKNSNRLRHLFLKLRRLALLLISYLKREFDGSLFRPEFYELKIGTNGVEPLTLTLKDGSRVSLYGTVDRVDVWKNEGEVYIRVVDYKTGDATFSLSDVAKGLNLQLLIYLFTLCRKDTGFAKMLGCNDGESPIPAAANYLSSKISTEKYPDLPTPEKALADAENRINRSGVFLKDDEVLASLTKESIPKKSLFEPYDLENLRIEFESTVIRIAEEMRSGAASAKPIDAKKSPCNFCKMASVCRNKKESKSY